MALDWKPRGRDLVMGEIAWLPRITDKARADAAGTIGDYFYPCPADKGFLERTLMGSESDRVARRIRSAGILICPLDR